MKNYKTIKEISLVELSTLEDKPKYVLFENVLYQLRRNTFYGSDYGVLLHDRILFKNFNLRNIMVIEEHKPLLTEEEKEYVKMIEKFTPYKITKIGIEGFNSKYKYITLFDEFNNSDVGTYIDDTRFKNLETNKKYTLEELEVVL